MPTSLILIPSASIGPASVKTRTELLSSWRLRRRLSRPKLRLRNMGRGSKHKLTHPLRLNKITKVHSSFDRGARGVLARAIKCALTFGFLKAITTKVTKFQEGEAENRITTVFGFFFVYLCVLRGQWVSIFIPSNYFIPSRIEPTIPPTTPPSTVRLDSCGR